MLATACGDPASDPLTADAQGDVNDTSTVTVYTSQPDQDISALVDAFNEEHPGITVNVFRSGTEEILGRARAEHENNALGGDVFFIADAISMHALRTEGLLEPYSSPEADVLPQEFIDPEGYFSGTKIISTGIVYNTDRVSSAPSSWDDLADADSVVMPSPLYSGAAAYNVTLMSEDERFGWRFWEDLAPRATVVQGNGAVLESVASGEHAYGLIVDFMAVRAAVEGSPVGFIYPTEGVPVITEPVALSAAGADNDAARTFIDFVLSAEGQEVAAELGYVPLHPDVVPPEGLQGARDLTVIDGDAAGLANQIEPAKEQFATLYGTS